jgi:hypothetical protein
LHQCFLPLGGMPEMYITKIAETMNTTRMNGTYENQELKFYTEMDKYCFLKALSEKIGSFRMREKLGKPLF